MKTITHVLLVILLLVFSGCASMSKRTKCVCASAAAGAGVGAGLGAIVGFQGDRDSGEGAAVGVAVGGLVGGALGLILCKGEELDSDGDGVPDSIDECPNTPIGVEVDAKGCPIDSDGDGVPDYLDKCPNTPKGVKVDAKGCPIDSDGDGVPDYLDKCPNTPKGCKVDKDGCPIDSDGDGVPDCLDKCPNTPRDTKVDKNGCPIVGEELLILHGIKFAFDSAKISDDSKAILEVAVTTLKRNPKMKVEIEGHTDSIGTAEYNLGLSQRRADAVQDHLISEGIGAERLQAVGKGEADPLVSNELKEGRAKNRRVEFVVISK
ncbi:MAG: OmpA family protein [Deltaproteobacteria bacterium]|nr:OmpA family protein [Deltaproteobacteria bacterium]